MIMAVETYAGSTIGKFGLAALGKVYAVSAATAILTLGTVVLSVVAGALVIKEIASFEILNEKELKPNQT